MSKKKSKSKPKSKTARAKAKHERYRKKIIKVVESMESAGIPIKVIDVYSSMYDRFLRRKMYNIIDDVLHRADKVIEHYEEESE